MTASLALFFFPLLFLSFLVFVVALLLHKPTAEAAFVVAAASLGVLILMAVWSAYQDGQINPSIGTRTIFRRIVLRESEPLLFHAILGAFAIVGLGLAALIPVSIWRLVARMRMGITALSQKRIP